MFNLDFSSDGMNDDRSDVISALLAHISPQKRIRCRLILFDMPNFNFQQLQDNVLKFQFFRFSCHLIYLLKFHPLPNFDRIRQLPLFDRLQSIDTVSDVAIIYCLKWTDVYHAVLK
jgi:hypothetical protein